MAGEELASLESLGKVDLATISAQIEALLQQNPWLIWVILIVAVWKLTWYGFAIYRSVEKKQKAWFVVLFVCAFVLNDLGLLPILYLILNKKPSQETKEEKKTGKSAKKK